LRKDGRKPNELRPVKIERDYLKYAEGSVLVEFGNTKVICTVSVQDGVPPFLKGKGQGWITAEYSMLPRAGQTRNIRESVAGRIGGRTHEIQRMIGRAMRTALDLTKVGERTFWDFVAAVSVGIVGDEVLLDLNFEEDSSAKVDMNVVATGQGMISEIQAMGEENTFTKEQFDKMFALAMGGIKQLVELQRSFFEIKGGIWFRKDIKQARLE